jgi:hypothetical protein
VAAVATGASGAEQAARHRVERAVGQHAGERDLDPRVGPDDVARVGTAGCERVADALGVLSGTSPCSSIRRAILRTAVTQVRVKRSLLRRDAIEGSVRGFAAPAPDLGADRSGLDHADLDAPRVKLFSELGMISIGAGCAIPALFTSP